MNKIILAGFLLLFTVLSIACSGNNPYSDPAAQRERSKQAQDELRRDTSR